MTADEAELRRISQLAEIGRYAEARALTAAALATTPDSAELHHQMARLMLEESPFQARDHARRACALAPDRFEHHMVLARALWLAGNLPAARAASVEAVRLAPASATAHALFAQITADLAPGSADAHRAALRAVDLAPNSAHAHFSAGYVFQAAGDKARARQAYETTLGIDPQHAAALNNLGVIGASLSRAARSYRAALSVDPQQRTARKNLDTILPRLLLRLWALGMTVMILGTLLTVAAGTADHSRPSVLSIALAVAAPVVYAVQCWLVLSHLPRGVVRQLLVSASQRGRRLLAFAVATVVFVAGESVCLVPGAGSGVRHDLPLLVILGGIQTYRVMRRR